MHARIHAYPHMYTKNAKSHYVCMYMYVYFLVNDKVNGLEGVSACVINNSLNL